MRVAKRIYHALIPAQLRNPLGLARRQLTSRVRALVTRGSAGAAKASREPAGMDVGRVIAGTIWSTVDLFLGTAARHRVLDLGSDSARSLRHLSDTGWRLTACDSDEGGVLEVRRLAPQVRVDLVNETVARLPYADSAFDVVYAATLFTRCTPALQRAWLAEIARVLTPGGIAVLSTMSADLLPAFPEVDTPAARRELADSGVLVARGNHTSLVFETSRVLSALAAPQLRLTMWRERGLAGFQDLVVLRREG